MKVTITYPFSGHVRVHSGLTQKEANSLVSHVSNIQDTMGYVPVTVKVEEE